MTPQAIRAELRALEQQRAQLEAVRVAAAAAVDVGLAADHFDPRVVHEARERLALAVRQLRDVDDRHEALTRALPSPAVIRQAEVDLEVCRTTFATTATTFNDSATELLAALDVAEVVGRRLAAARRGCAAIVNTMLITAQSAGLQLADLPTVPTLAPAQARVAHLIGLLLADIAAHGEPDDLVARDLASARSDAAEAQTAAA